MVRSSATYTRMTIKIKRVKCVLDGLEDDIVTLLLQVQGEVKGNLQ